MPFYKTGKSKIIDGRKLQQYRVVVNYTDTDGKHKKLTRRIYGKEEAGDLEKELMKKVQEKDVVTKRMTLRKLYDEYIAAKEYEVRSSSLSRTKSILKNHVLNTDLQNKRLDRLTVPVLQKWKNELGKKDIMISTKNNAIRELNTLLNYAVRMEYIPKNPLKNIGKFKNTNFTAVQEKVRYYTADEFKRYIAAARDSRENLTDYGCYIFFNIAFFTGMRKGEINALRWSDIEGNVIHVRRSINQKIKDENGNYTETPPKNESSSRDLQIPSNLMKLLEDHRHIIDKNIGYSANLRVCGGYKPISDTNLENHNTQYAQTAGLPHRTIHEFRHSHATLLCNAGINIQEVARRLGHADVKMTWNTYSHLYPQAEEKALEILAKI